MPIAKTEAEKLIAKYSEQEAIADEINTIQRLVLQDFPSLRDYPYRQAACISLVQDIGIVRFRISTVARYIKRGEYRAAADAFMQLVYGNKMQQRRLVNRRQAERTMFRREEV